MMFVSFLAASDHVDEECRRYSSRHGPSTVVRRLHAVITGWSGDVSDLFEDRDGLGISSALKRYSPVSDRIVGQDQESEMRVATYDYMDLSVHRLPSFHLTFEQHSLPLRIATSPCGGIEAMTLSWVWASAGNLTFHVAFFQGHR